LGRSIIIDICVIARWHGVNISQGRRLRIGEAVVGVEGVEGVEDGV